MASSSLGRFRALHPSPRNMPQPATPAHEESSDIGAHAALDGHRLRQVAVLA